MLDIFSYLDFRKFLKDYYDFKKSENANFSYQVFANKAGFKSKSFLVHVIEGKANLSNKSIFAVAKALGLKGQAFNYFENLVEFNQAKNPAQKSHFFTTLAGFSKGKKARKVREDEFEFYSRWYHSTIRELVTIIDFNEDYHFLGKYVTPEISEYQARKSVELLLHLGLIRKKGKRYEQTDKSLTTGDEVQSTAVNSFHVENFSLSKRALEKIPAGSRDVSCIVAGMSTMCFESVKKEIQLFRKKLMQIIENDQERAEKVYHINFQMFPTSRQKERA